MQREKTGIPAWNYPDVDGKCIFAPEMEITTPIKEDSMKKFRLIMFVVSIIAATQVIAENSTDTVSENAEVLFLYDKIKGVSMVHVNAFRDAFKTTGITVEEIAVDDKSTIDLIPCPTIVLYSMVMAFDNMSPVRAWLKRQKSLKGKRMYVFVTANRWFYKKHLKKLMRIVKNRGGEVVDGMTMATHAMSGDEKREAVNTFVSKVK